MDKTALVKCTCKNSFQDATYGKGMRVTTPNNTEQAKGSFIVRCTVCGTEHNLGSIYSLGGQDEQDRNVQ